MNKFFHRFYLLVVILWLIGALWFSRFVRDWDAKTVMSEQQKQTIELLQGRR